VRRMRRRRMKIDVLGECADLVDLFSPTSLKYSLNAQNENVRHRRRRGMKMCVVGEGAE
jgi:hypothetical protein